MRSAPARSLRLVEYLCPAGHVVTRLTDRVVYLGSPERRCPLCGTATTVPQYCEWTDMTDAQRQAIVRGFVMNTIFAGSGVGLLYLMISVTAAVMAALPGPSVLLLAAVSFALGVGTVAALHVVRVRQSVSRTANG